MSTSNIQLQKKAHENMIYSWRYRSLKRRRFPRFERSSEGHDFRAENKIACFLLPADEYRLRSPYDFWKFASLWRRIAQMFYFWAQTKLESNSPLEYRLSKAVTGIAVQFVEGSGSSKVWELTYISVAKSVRFLKSRVTLKTNSINVLFLSPNNIGIKISAEVLAF